MAHRKGKNHRRGYWKTPEALLAYRRKVDPNATWYRAKLDWLRFHYGIFADFEMWQGK